MSVAITFWNSKENAIYLVTDSCMCSDESTDKSFELKNGIWVAETGVLHDIIEFPPVNWDSLENIHGGAFRWITEGYNDIDMVAQIIFEKYISILDDVSCFIVGFKKGIPRIIKELSRSKKCNGIGEKATENITFIGTDELKEIPYEKKLEVGKIIFDDTGKALSLVIDAVIEIQKTKGIHTVAHPIKIVKIYDEAETQITIIE